MKKYEELDITDPFIFAKVMSEKKNYVNHC